MPKEEDVKQIANAVEDCRGCALWKTRHNAVAGSGSADATILFVGEAPGYHEDQQGIPFVGKAGKILDELLASIGLQRGEIYIANILKCRPPQNRNPLKSEIEAPRLIAPLGNFAASYLFEKFGLPYDKISKIHGKIFRINTVFGKITIVPLYHPAVATYNPETKSTLLEDFKAIEKAVDPE